MELDGKTYRRLKIKMQYSKLEYLKQERLEIKIYSFFYFKKGYIMASKRLSIEEQIEKKEESIDLTKDEFLKLIKTLNDEEIGLNIMEIL